MFPIKFYQSDYLFIKYDFALYFEFNLLHQKF